MPHKHKRKRGDDFSEFNLEPSSRAKALSVHTPRAQNEASLPAPKKQKIKQNSVNGRPKRKSNIQLDDTPKSFARLMAFQKTGKRIASGLDEGKRKEKKIQTTNKKEEGDQIGNSIIEQNLKSENAKSISQRPQIQPGERLSEFAIRVNQSIPLHGESEFHSTSSTKPGLVPGLRTPLTKHNKRLLRMQKEWRETEARLRAKKEEAEDEADLDDKREEEGLLWSSIRDAQGMRKGKKNKNKRDGEEGDPWKILERKRREEGKEKRGLMDVVQAPPVLPKVKNIFLKERRRQINNVSSPRIAAQMPRAILT